MTDLVSVSSIARDSVSLSEESRSADFIKQLAKDGRLPPVELVIIPLDPARPQVSIKRFISYEFNSSMITPVDSFSFEFAAPDDERPIDEIIRSGDIVQLRANGRTLSTGIIDAVDDETTEQGGESVTLMGRDLMSQLEDSNAVTMDNRPFYGGEIPIQQVVKILTENTRINPTPILQSMTTKAWLFATEPTETKLAALQRYLEPLNAIAWMDPNGRIKVGKPNMGQRPLGRMFMLKRQRLSNVISMKTIRETTRVPNVILPIWAGQEGVQAAVKESALFNNRPAPARLLKFGHRVIRTVVYSTPQGSSAQDQAEVNRLNIAGGQNILQAMAKRELARANVSELSVQVILPGHYNAFGDPFLPDTTYQILNDRSPVDETMYLYEVKYSLSQEGGQRSLLSFCPLWTIVADQQAP